MIMLVGDINRSIEAINKAIQMSDDSASVLAKKMGVSKQLIYHWRLKGLPPLDFGEKIFVATEGKVGADEVCPHYASLVSQSNKLIIRKYRRRKVCVKPVNEHQKNL